VAAGPGELAFDGANIWVSNILAGQVTKLSRNGTILGTFNVGGSYPYGVAFDGASIWVASNNALTKLSLSGTVLGTFPAGSGATGIAFDGANIWVTDFAHNNVSKF
jgi:DNA-binding beta-propeller fold protein YncE